MNYKLKSKIQESLASVLPVAGIVLALSIFFVPMNTDTVMMFLFGTLMLVVGMGMFQLGAEMSMTPIGKGIGVQMSKSKNAAAIALVGLIMGVFITVAEPDLQVLAGQVPAIPDRVLILTVALGVGLSSMRRDKDASGDSFGLTALCSIGPILAVMILGCLYSTSEFYYISH